MNKIQANNLKKLLEQPNYFKVEVKESSVVVKYSLIVHEIANVFMPSKDNRTMELTRYAYMNAFCTIHQVGMHIKADQSVPYYFIY